MYVGDNSQWGEAQCIPNVQPHDTWGAAELDWFHSGVKSSCQGSWYLFLHSRNAG